MTDAERKSLIEYKEFYEGIYPPLVDELRRVWAAFGLNYDDMEYDIEQILMEGQKGAWRTASDMLPPGCSVFSLPPGATKDGEAMVGRNLDWSPTPPCSLVFMYPKGAYSSVGCTNTVPSGLLYTNWRVGMSLLLWRTSQLSSTSFRSDLHLTSQYVWKAEKGYQRCGAKSNPFSHI